VQNNHTNVNLKQSRTCPPTEIRYKSEGEVELEAKTGQMRQSASGSPQHSELVSHSIIVHFAKIAVIASMIRSGLK
jgi:hypothetical protein